jgi:hypothetical protein
MVDKWKDKLHVWVDLRVPPSGNVTAIGVVAGCLLTTAALWVRKCPDAPESLRAYVVVVGVVVVARATWVSLLVGGWSSSSVSSVKIANGLVEGKLVGIIVGGVVVRVQ